jgi:hypothetical protein
MISRKKPSEATSVVGCTRIVLMGAAVFGLSASPAPTEDALAK